MVAHPRDLSPSLGWGNKRGFFSEEHGDVGGVCECGPCVFFFFFFFFSYSYSTAVYREGFGAARHGGSDLQLMSVIPQIHDVQLRNEGGKSPPH